MLGRLARLFMNEARALRSLALKRASAGSGAAREISREFHRLYFELCSETWLKTSWLGVPAQKCPLDLWIYQELVTEVGPDLVIETGTADGGSALFLASVCDALGGRRTVTVDVKESPLRRPHERIEYVVGSSVADEVVERMAREARGSERVMVILDSDHARAHVLREMRAYGPLVTPGSYRIVEDTNLNGHPVHPGHGPGPMEAVDEFLEEHPEFEPDRSRERLLLTFNPKGYLRRR